MSARVAVRYAKPILELAEERNSLDNVKSDMENFLEIFNQNRDFSMMIKSPIVPHKKKASILKTVFEGKFDALTMQAFDLITNKNREDILANIAQEFLNLYNTKKGLSEAVLTTAVKIDDAERKKFGELANKISGSTAILEEKVDKSIIGGFILRVGDKRIDESIKGKLNNLKLKFSN